MFIDFDGLWFFGFEKTMKKKICWFQICKV